MSMSSAKRTRILFFESGEFGGSIVCLNDLLSGLHRAGCELGLVSYYRRTGPFDVGSSRLLSFFHSLDLPARSRPRPEMMARVAGIPYPTRFALRYLRDSLRAIRTFQPDVVYLNCGIESLAPAIIASRLAGVPSISHLRIARSIHPKELLLGRMVYRFVALTEAGRRVAIESGLPTEKISQMYDPFDLEGFTSRMNEQLAVSLPWEADGLYIAQVGALSERKRPLLALDAFEVAQRECPQLRLIFAGTGPLLETIRNEVIRRQLNGRVHLIGTCTQIPALLKRCHIGLFTSSSEGLGLVLLEFLAAGIPWVATDLPCFREIVADGESGIIAEHNAASVGAALARLATSAEVRTQMGSRGRSTIEHDHRFKPDEHICRIHRMILELKNRKSTVRASRATKSSGDQPSL